MKPKSIDAPPPDPVAAAVAAVEAEAQTLRLLQLEVTMSSTGRPAALTIPEDVTDGELAELCGWILKDVLLNRRNFRAEREGKKILVAQSMPAGLRPA